MNATGLCLSFGTTIIYSDAEFNLSPRDKVGIIGVNGAGKTTLFRILSGEIIPDAGKINIANSRIGYLPQTINIPDMNITVWDFLLSGRPIKDLQEKLQAAYDKIAVTPDSPEIINEISRIQDELDYYQVYNAEDALLSLIDNMKFNMELLDSPLCNLSGGQKSKVAFARMLYSMPEILLLDEPTNHLDVTTKDFVTEYLRKYKGMVLIISHDTEFLNKIVDKILYIDKTSHKISVFTGNYNEYKKKSAEIKRARDKQIASEERQIQHLNEFINRARSASPTNHSIKKAGNTRAAQLAKILAARTQREQIYKKIQMDLTPMRPGARIPIMIENLWFRFPGQRLLYRNLSFYITGGERFLVVGENGTGKSTLLKLIMGFLTPERGDIKINPKTDIAYYAQELELLDLNKTIIENVASDDYTDQQLRAVLANFLFSGTDVVKKISVLSPGERARVALCKMLLRRANMLILDEPTNHLDPETQRIIGDNFRDYCGTIIVVSHNPDFVEQIGINRMLILPSGRIEEYDHSTMEHYYFANKTE